MFLRCCWSPPDVRTALLALPNLYGDASVLERARGQLPHSAQIGAALDELAAMVKLAGAANVTVDLDDLSGYQYESGAMFALYEHGLPNAVARGGRYDQLGDAYGRARPAT